MFYDIPRFNKNDKISGEQIQIQMRLHKDFVLWHLDGYVVEHTLCRYVSVTSVVEFCGRESTRSRF